MAGEQEARGRRVGNKGDARVLRGRRQESWELRGFVHKVELMLCDLSSAVAATAVAMFECTSVFVAGSVLDKVGTYITKHLWMSVFRSKRQDTM